MGNALSCLESHSEDWDGKPDLPNYRLPARDVMDDMNLPLSSYLISSGHNSYLTGNQLNSASGTTTIEKCLQQNCRVIELDVYNQQGDFDGPVCKHGGTLTAPISFKACVQAVGKNAFAASPYPVIITIENHTDEANQVQMAEILMSSLGSLLYVPAPGEEGKPWKSPEQLKNKVLIRTNAAKAVPELRRLVYIANTKFKSLQAANESGKTSSSSFGEDKAKKLLKKALEASGVATKAELNPSVSSKKKSGKPMINALPQDSLRRPASAASSAAGAALEAPADDIPDEALQTVHSLGELYAYTAHNLMRVYPGGLRIDSSNYNPTIAWSAGASFAALNWQKWDQPLWVNSALFSLNGGCGYVLKPHWMLDSLITRSTSQNGSGGAALPNPLPHRHPRTLAVTIYSAYVQQYGSFACFKDDVYVQMDVVGMPMDNQTQSTHVANNTGRLLVDKTYAFKVSFLEIAVLVLKLKDKDLPGNTTMDDDLGHWEIPLASLHEGEYKVLLQDNKKVTRSDRWIKLRLEWMATAEDMHNPAATSKAPSARVSSSNAPTTYPPIPPATNSVTLPPVPDTPAAAAAAVDAAAAAAVTVANPLAAGDPAAAAAAAGALDGGDRTSAGGKRERKRI